MDRYIMEIAQMWDWFGMRHAFILLNMSKLMYLVTLITKTMISANTTTVNLIGALAFL